MLFARLKRERRHGLLLDRPLDDPLCCRGCDALCCRSFPAVDLSWEEYQQLLALGATRLHFALHGPHKLMIENGCEFLRGNRCGIYARRPGICRRFICRSDPTDPAG